MDPQGLVRLLNAAPLSSSAPFVLTPELNLTFVPPPLTVVGGSRDNGIVLLSAPAAVGKTTLANYLGAASGAALWDLASLRLGDNVLTGSLGRAYGYAMLGKIIHALASGGASLILDGLDEAYVRSGVEGLESLASDVRAVTEQRAAGPDSVALVVLGRSAAIELFELTLEDQGLAAERMEVGFFDPDAANRLIDLQAGEATGHPVYADARDRLLEAIAASIGDSTGDDRRSFLGYAPVLNALGRYLAEPAEVLSALERERVTGWAYWEELAKLNEEILEREQRKVWNQLDRPGAVARSFFSPRHQVQVLLSENPRVALDLGCDASDENARRQASNAGQTALENHPFVRSDHLDDHFSRRFVNTVFRDYLVATALHDEELLDIFVEVDAAFWSGDYAPSSLAALFYLRPGADGIASIAVDPELLAFLQASLAAEMPHHDEPVTMVITEAGEQLAVSVGRRALSQTLDFSVAPSRSMTLAAPLSHVSAEVPAASVRLRPIGEEVDVGPRVNLSALAIDLDGSRLWVEADRTAPVVFSANAIHLLAPHLDVRVQDDGRGLQVSADDIPFALRRFGVAPARPAEEPPDLVGAMKELRRLVAWFSTGPVGELSYFKKPLLNAVSKGRVSRSMLEFALDRQLLREDDKVYVLNSAEFQLDLFRLRRGEMNEAIKDFVREYVSSEPAPDT